MSGLDDPVVGLNTSQVEEVSSLLRDNQSISKEIENNVSINVSKDELREPEQPLKNSDIP